MKKKLTLDLTKDKCPVAFIKTREFLSNTPKNEHKFLIIGSNKTLKELKSTLNEQQVKFSVTKKLNNFILKIEKLNI